MVLALFNVLEATLFADVKAIVLDEDGFRGILRLADVFSLVALLFVDVFALGDDLSVADFLGDGAALFGILVLDGHGGHVLAVVERNPFCKPWWGVIADRVSREVLFLENVVAARGVTAVEEIVADLAVDDLALHLVTWSSIAD